MLFVEILKIGMFIFQFLNINRLTLLLRQTSFQSKLQKNAKGNSYELLVNTHIYIHALK